MNLDYIWATSSWELILIFAIGIALGIGFGLIIAGLHIDYTNKKRMKK